MNINGKIYKIARYAIHDGPGIRTTVFLKGCPLRCIWCCNPESQSYECEIMWNSSICSSCKLCTGVCEQGAIAAEGPSVKGINRYLCTKCGRCVDICPRNALLLVGRIVTPEELFAEVRKDEPFWRRSGGGVTLSGGEVLAQPSFAKAFFDICKKHFIHTAIETSLFAPFETMVSVVNSVDLVQFDIKAIDSSLHKKITAVDNAVILKNAAWLLEGDKDVLVRFPLIPGINDFREEIESLGSFVSRYRRGAKLEILKYHRMGVGSYGALGREYAIPDIPVPTERELEAVLSILRRYAVDVVCG